MLAKAIPDLKTLRSLKFDLDSPRLVQAYKNLGLEREQLVRKRLRHFEDPAQSQAQHLLHYHNHLNQLKEVLNEVIIERRDAKKLLSTPQLSRRSNQSELLLSVGEIRQIGQMESRNERFLMKHAIARSQ